jgi:hypothetical protein
LKISLTPPENYEVSNHKGLNAKEDCITCIIRLQSGFFLDIPQGRAKDLGKETIEEFQKMQKKEQESEGGQQPGVRPATPRVRPRIVLRFTKDEKKLLISGGLYGGSELAGAPAVVDCKLGDGHVVLFSINLMWRHQTHGSYSLVLNAIPSSPFSALGNCACLFSSHLLSPALLSISHWIVQCSNSPRARQSRIPSKNDS